MKLSCGLDLQVVQDPRLQIVKYDETIYIICMLIHICLLVTWAQSDQPSNLITESHMQAKNVYCILQWH